MYEKTCHKKAVIENMYILPIYPVPDGSLCIHFYRGPVRRGSEGTLSTPPQEFLCLEKRPEYVGNLSLLALLDSKSKRASILCAHEEGLELAGNSEMVSKTFLISFSLFIQ